MKLAAILLLAVRLFAQPVLTLTGPATVASGQSATLTVSLSGTSGQNLAAVQWTITAPASLTWSTPTISAGAAALGKGVYCNPTSGVCVALGATNATPPVLSATPFTDGAVASLPATFSMAPGTVSLPLSSLLGASTAAAAVSVGSGAVFTLTVTPSHCDYNGDGKVDVNDALAVISAVIGQTTCSASFAAGCSLHSLQAIVVAALGGACSL
jgi:hypothetical protein